MPQSRQTAGEVRGLRNEQGESLWNPSQYLGRGTLESGK